MPFDGISFNEAGFKMPLPAENHLHAELASKAQANLLIKKAEDIHKIKREGKNKKDGKKQQSKDAEDEEETFDENLPEFVNKFKAKKYKVSFNRSKELVELIDRETGTVIETITPDDLLSLVSKSKTASGILVDKKI